MRQGQQEDDSAGCASAPAVEQSAEVGVHLPQGVRRLSDHLAAAGRAPALQGRRDGQALERFSPILDAVIIIAGGDLEGEARLPLPVLTSHIVGGTR